MHPCSIKELHVLYLLTLSSLLTDIQKILKKVLGLRLLRCNTIVK